MQPRNIHDFFPSTGNRYGTAVSPGLPGFHRPDTVFRTPRCSYCSPLFTQERHVAFMWSWIDSGVALVALYPACALAVVFAAAIIEAVAVLGILIPGTPILMAVAGAAAMAGHAMLPYLALSILGAVIGDFLSFVIGRRFSSRLRRVWPFCRRPALMNNATAFFDRYGLLSVALCRFVPVLRSTVPLVAGMAGMPPRRFVVANILSACVWAPVHIYPAQMAGLSLDRLRGGDWGSALFWAVALLACCAAGWGLHRALITRAR